MAPIHQITDGRIARDARPCRWAMSAWKRSIFVPDDAKDWRPRSLRPTFLISVILISGGLIGVLQYLLSRSQQDNGIIFADDITKLPLSRSFPYLYLPTIIAVIYGFAWTWIDLDVRRIEPFYQLAKENGAPAEESLLLAYPVDFIASVPLKALRYRHWSPFVASLATVFVFWGLTPSQAGIFASSSVDRTFAVPMAYSTSHVSLAQQAESLSAKSATSVSNILWLNETLQPFMTREAMLAPFGPLPNASLTEQGEWTGQTWQYFADVSCEDAIVWTRNEAYWLNSTWGCSYNAPSLRTRAVLNETNEAKLFDTLYVGYYNENGNAPYYLSNRGCLANQSNSFMIQFSKASVSTALFVNMTATEQRDNADVTTLYCRSSYYAQRVRATIQMPDRNVVRIEPQAVAQPLPGSLFNTSAFESSMSQGQDRARTEFPSLDWPDQTSYLEDTELFLGFMSKMAPFAIGSTNLPMNEYLSKENLEGSYRKAYQLLFARQLADVLLQVMDESTATSGTVSIKTQAIIIVPTFAYIAQVLLGAACLFAAAILYLSSRRPTKLKSDPASLAALMSLAADSPALLKVLGQHDTSTTEELDDALRAMSFKLGANSASERRHHLMLNESSTFHYEYDKMIAGQAIYQKSEGTVPGVQPVELSLKIGFAFFLTLLAISTVLGYLFFQAQKLNGLALPSSDRFIRQFLENYLPTGIGTMIEPFWLLLNRNLCYLQPFEALRTRPQTSSRTIGLNYVSLPPQLVVGKALFGRHYLLATVCLMTLLANVLSVSLSGLFFEAEVIQPVKMAFSQPDTMRFQALDAKAPPVANSTGDSVAPFYIATSNQTAGTPLPPWINSRFFFQPFTSPGVDHSTPSLHRARTQAFGASLLCSPLSDASAFTVTGTIFNDRGMELPSRNNLTVALQNGNDEVICIPRKEVAYGFNVDPLDIFFERTGNCAFEFTYALQAVNGSTSEEDNFCQQHLANGWVRARLSNGTTTIPSTGAVKVVPTVIESYTSLILVCRSRILSGSAEVTVSNDGHVLDVEGLNHELASELAFESSAGGVIGQAHHSILRAGRKWHNDTNPSDFGNYLIAQATNSNILLDPNSDLPPFDVAAETFSALYSKLFAIWLQQNREQVFEASADQMIDGVQLEPQTRIFMSMTMFVLSECILALYMVVTILLYAHRPWKVLCRLPTSLASILAYCAASRAVVDLRDTVQLSGYGLQDHLKELGFQYGFGSFVGPERTTHVGIERSPFVVPLTRPGLGSTSSDLAEEGGHGPSHRLRTRLRYWRSGKAREGGWL